MKTLSREEMKHVMGGLTDPYWNPANGRCCFTGTTDCSGCYTGLHCNSNATWSAC